MASTLLNEHGWHPDAIERQLAHGESNDVRAAYNYAEYLPERVLMMQAWANYLDDLRAEKLDTTSLDHRSSAANARASMRRLHALGAASAE